MKKHALLLMAIFLVSGCYNPGGRSWMIPVSIDPSDLSYTPAHEESFEMRRNQVIESLGGAKVILRSWDQHSHNRHQFRPNNYFYYLTGHEGPVLSVAFSPDGQWLAPAPMPSGTAIQTVRLYFPRLHRACGQRFTMAAS